MVYNRQKASFLNHSRPLITCMIQTADKDDCLATVKNAIYDGADAFGFQICRFDSAQRTEENYKSIFNKMGGRPIYITNYRTGYSDGCTDGELMEELIRALECGATMADVMGDTFDKCEYELTEKKEAVEKQKELIDRIHSMGKEVLMSSHIHVFKPADWVVEHALKIQNRGADVVKIVTGADSPEEEIENIRITNLLRKELSVPFLFLSNGTNHKIHRMVGSMFGCAMVLCAERHDALSTKGQPTVRSMHDVLYHTDWMY